MAETRQLTVYRCGDGHGHTITLDGEGGRGTRLTRGKCCAQQYRHLVAKWALDAKQLRELGNELLEQAEEIA